MIKRILAIAACAASFLRMDAVAQAHGPNELDPRPLESAYVLTERGHDSGELAYDPWNLAYGSAGLSSLDPAAMSLLQANPTAANKWHFDFMLYGLFGNLSGDVAVNGHEADVDIGTQQILDNLQFTAAGRARLGYERWFTAVDVLYLGMAGSTDNPPADMEYRMWIGQMTFGYGINDQFDAFAGARYNQQSAELDFQGPLGLQRSGKQDWWDPIIGGIFNGRISEHFAYSIYLDVGGFGVGSEITTRFEPMISWYFNRHGSVDLAYEAYYVDYENSSDGFEYDTLMYGPILGLSMHF